MVLTVVIILGTLILGFYLAMYVRNKPHARRGTREDRVDDLTFERLEKRFQREQRRRDELPPTHE